MTTEKQRESLEYLVEIGSSGPHDDDSRLDAEDREALRELLDERCKLACANFLLIRYIRENLFEVGEDQ